MEDSRRYISGEDVIEYSAEPPGLQVDPISVRASAALRLSYTPNSSKHIRRAWTESHNRLTNIRTRWRWYLNSRPHGSTPEPPYRGVVGLAPEDTACSEWSLIPCPYEYHVDWKWM